MLHDPDGVGGARSCTQDRGVALVVVSDAEGVAREETILPVKK